MSILSNEERANVWTHALAIPFCILGSIWLLWGSHVNQAVYIGLWVYCISLTAVYIISTLYHYQTKPRLKHFFRVVDHIAIYFLIAGTHTPFLLLYLTDTYGQCFLAGLWLVVVFGMVFKIRYVGEYEGFSVFLYLAMGWSAVFTLPYIWHQFPENALLWIFIGGVSYTVGGIFYMLDQLPYNHALWHVFVIGGSLGHFWAVWLCVA